MLLLLAAVLPPPAADSQVQPGASLFVLRGTVAVSRADGTAVYPAGTGLTLAVGDMVGTLDRTRALVTFFTGSEIELGSNTSIVIRRLDRDLLEQASVTLQHITGLTVIRTPDDPTNAAVRVLTGDTVSLIRSGEIGHGVDPNTNNISVACVDGRWRCATDASAANTGLARGGGQLSTLTLAQNGPTTSLGAFPTESSFLVGQMVRTLTGRGDLIDQKIGSGDSVWDVMAEAGSIGQQDGTSNTSAARTSRTGDDDNPGQDRPAATPTPTASPTATPTVVTTPTPPAGDSGPACNTPTNASGAGQVTTTVHNLGRTSGTVTINYDAFGIADTFEIFYEGGGILTTGAVSGAGTRTVPFGPGSSTFIQVRVTGSTPTSVWTYTITCS